MLTGKIEYLSISFMAILVSCLFSLPAFGSVTIATVPVANPGNAANADGLGDVGYDYSIGKYDVTADQYTAFLNAVAESDPFGVYNSTMAGTTTGNPGIIRSGLSGAYTYSVAADRGSHPVTDVTFWDAARFANWLDNGEPTGAEGASTTETGAYTLTSTGIANNTVTRNADATWVIPNVNEWYKAAYYSPALNNGAGGYWQYATQTYTIDPYIVNFNDPPPPEINDSTAVGSYNYSSYYGLYDDTGNVDQWNETIYQYGQWRGMRGGSFDAEFGDVGSSFNGPIDPTTTLDFAGFRVAEVPEPTALGIVTFAVIGLTMRKK